MKKKFKIETGSRGGQFYRDEKKQDSLYKANR